jgi:hypothetical protein
MSDRLTPGETYIVEAVEGGKYVVVCGYTHPGGGIYWTEFKEALANVCFGSVAAGRGGKQTFARLVAVPMIRSIWL